MRREEYIQQLHHFSEQLEELDRTIIDLAQRCEDLRDLLKGDTTKEQLYVLTNAQGHLRDAMRPAFQAKNLIDQLLLYPRNFPPEFPVFDHGERRDE
jgi:hypothetical protein